MSFIYCIIILIQLFLLLEFAQFPMQQRPIQTMFAQKLAVQEHHRYVVAIQPQPLDILLRGNVHLVEAEATRKLVVVQLGHQVVAQRTRLARVQR